MPSQSSFLRVQGLALVLCGLTVLTLLSVAAVAAPARASEKIVTFDGQVTADAPGAPFTQAGGHPFDISTVVEFETKLNPDSGIVESVEDVREVVAELPLGLVGNLPSIIQGIPLDIRDVRVNVNRDDFTLNPTSCDPMAFSGSATSVYLRSSSHPLPDLVVALRGQIDIDLSGRIDSVNGGIRNTFDLVPDAPVSRFVLTMKGGKKGLLENSTNLCAQANKAKALIDGQNGKTADQSPALSNSCGKKPKRR